MTDSDFNCKAYLCPPKNFEHEVVEYRYQIPFIDWRPFSWPCHFYQYTNQFLAIFCTIPDCGYSHCGAFSFWSNEAYTKLYGRR